MRDALYAAAELDPLAIAKVIAVVLAISLLTAILQATLRDLVWSFFNFVTAFFAFLCRIVLTFVNFSQGAHFAKRSTACLKKAHTVRISPGRGLVGLSLDRSSIAR